MLIIVGYLVKKSNRRKLEKNVENYRKLLGFMLWFLIKWNEGVGKYVIWYSKNELGKLFRNWWLWYCKVGVKIWDVVICLWCCLYLCVSMWF